MDISKQLKKYQEALIVLALRHAFPARKAEVFWNERFQDSYIDPDVTLGPDKLSPEVIVCVAHSDSEKESDKKFWRNAGELCFAKSRLPSRPLVVNVVFEAHYKPVLFTAMARSFDHQISLINDADAPNLVEAGPSIVSGGLKRITEKAAIIDYIETNVVSKSPYRAEFQRLTRLVASVLSKRVMRNESYWTSLAAVSPNNEQIAEFTFESTGAFRRGISKILCANAADRQEIYNSAKDGSRGSFPAFIFGLGWAQKTLRKDQGVIKDDDIKQLARSFTWSVIEQTIGSIPSTVLRGLERVGCQPCREYGSEMAIYTGFFIANTKRFTNATALKNLIKKGFDDPCGICPASTGRRWILDFGLAAGKAIRDRAQGYGMSQLARELTCEDPDKVRFWIPDYNSGKKTLPEASLDSIALVFSQKFNEIINIAGSAEAAAVAIAKWMGHTLVEVKLCTYRLFKPAEVLVSQVALSAGFEVTRAQLETCGLFSHGLAGIGTDGLLLSKNGKTTYIKVQSGAKNTHDKVKELSGRIGLSLKPTSECFHQQFESSILVLDGPFEKKEARMCFAAGWNFVLPLESVNERTLNSLSGLG